MQTSTPRSGFTLLELSIVLVIIGLLAGGIFTGSILIRSMELKTIQTEANEYRTAISGFRDRYTSYPGDMSNASQIWGHVSDTVGSRDCPDDRGSGSETCDGNGDQRIAPVTVTLADGGQSQESFRAWQHLQNAGMLSSKTSGVPGSAGDRDARVGSNIPRSRFDKAAGWSLFFIPYGTDTTGNCRQATASGGYARVLCRFEAGSPNSVFMERAYNHVVTLGEQMDGSFAVNPILAPQEAKSLDEKYDDGLPGSGAMTAIGDYAGDSNAAPDCFEASDPAGAGYTTQFDYSISERQKGCALMFVLE